MAKFNVALWDGRPETMAAYCGKLSAGVMLTHEEIADLKEFTDVLIYAKAHPNDFVPFGYKKVGKGFMPEDAVPPTPIPPMPPTDYGDRIRSAPSQWAKNFNLSDAEAAWAVAQGYWTEEDRHRLANWWHDNGVKGRRDPNGQYIYYTYPGGVETMHVDDGGADPATTEACGKPIPGPALP